MRTRKWSLQLIVGLFALTVCSSLSAAETKSAQPQTAASSKIRFNLKDEDDKTDILAIPSDSTEEELEEEMEELQKAQKK